MTTLFRLDSSIRIDGSVTRAVADTLEEAVASESGQATVIRREIGTTPLPSEAWATAAFAGGVPEDQRSPEQRQAIGLATELADELSAADIAIIGAPFYNWGVSQHVKSWADLVLTDPRFAPGGPGAGGKPAFVVIARGGGYGEGTPRHGWDHATDWLKRIITDVWGFDLKLIETELTLADTAPSMAHLVELAREKLTDAHASARLHGKNAGRELTRAST